MIIGHRGLRMSDLHLLLLALRRTAYPHENNADERTGRCQWYTSCCGQYHAFTIHDVIDLYQGHDLHTKPA